MDILSVYIIQRGKKLSYLLRHDKAYAFDEHGWRTVGDLVANHGFTLEELREIVAINDKQRYEFSDDMTRIRARQGHSIQVDVDLAVATPPDILYHGTARSSLDSIMKQGILKRGRILVHLSTTIETAMKVGERHVKKPDTVVVLSIDAKRMHDDGIKFYLSRNGVWMTEVVVGEYIIGVTE